MSLAPIESLSTISDATCFTRFQFVSPRLDDESRANTRSTFRGSVRHKVVVDEVEEVVDDLVAVVVVEVVVVIVVVEVVVDGPMQVAFEAIVCAYLPSSLIFSMSMTCSSVDVLPIKLISFNAISTPTPITKTSAMLFNLGVDASRTSLVSCVGLAKIMITTASSPLYPAELIKIVSRT